MRFSGSLLCLALSALIISAVPVPVSAADEEAQQQSSAPPVQPLDNPHQNELRKIALELSTALKPAELEALEKLRIGFGMVRAVKLVEDDVDEAVVKCAEENPDISDEITTRHHAWAEAVGGERRQAENQMESFIAGKTFSEPGKVKEYFEATDKVATYIDEQLDKRIITTPEACKFLLQSMDQTESQLSQLLKVIEWPVEAGESAAAETPEAGAESEEKGEQPAEIVFPGTGE